MFEGKRGPKPVAAHREPDLLYSEIGKLTIELDWLKKVWDQPAMIRQGWITKGEGVAIVQQCVLATVVIYRKNLRLAQWQTIIYRHHNRLYAYSLKPPATRSDSLS